MAKRKPRRKKPSSQATRAPRPGTAAAQAARRPRPGAAAAAQAVATARPPVFGKLAHVEHHRHGVALPLAAEETGGDRPGMAMALFLPEAKGKPLAACGCTGWSRKTGRCGHVDRLLDLHRTLVQRAGGQDLDAHFQASPWLRVLAPLAEVDEAPMHSVTVARAQEAPVLHIRGADGAVRAMYLAAGPDAERLYERLVAGTAVPRATMLDQLAARTERGFEAQMRMLGHRTEGQVLEASLWYRLAYHAHRELDPARAWVTPAVDPATGSLHITVHDERGPVLRVHVPRPAARPVLAALRDLPMRGGVPVYPARLRSLVRVTPRPDGSARVEPVVRVPARDAAADAGGEARVLALDAAARMGDVALLPAGHDDDAQMLVELDEPGPVAAALALDGPRDLAAGDMPVLLAAVAEAQQHADDDADEVMGLRLLRGFDRVEIDARALHRDWCWLSMRYGAGSAAVSLRRLLAARREGRRFVDTGAGWVDLESAALVPMLDLVDGPAHGGETRGDGDDGVRLSRMALLRLLLAGEMTVTCTGPRARELEDMLALVPARPLAPVTGLASTLRDYQARGVTWLLYLHDNRFGGLLCDDMGLGKTHQVMALMLALRGQRAVTGPYLVVCPTTVLSHWQRVLDTYAAGLRATVFHGGGRDLDAALAGADVVLTSYGIVRNDIDDLARVPFALVVFDEAQYLKNPETRAYGAAVRLQADMRLGLSGTPVENTLMDLKALLDLVLPGYLSAPGQGSADAAFRQRFVDPVEIHGDERARGALRRLISPFVLRRTKATVLDQLPPVIEDVRTCALSGEQIKLYRDAVDGRGQELMAALRDPERAVPYMHVFALLTLLKQICCHPALIAGAPAGAPAQHESGKWDLFQELLDESLASGQKVVVYSQFVGMIRIIERHLAARGVGHATLTGQTRKRGDVIARFAEDPDCRVFLATLQAGGVGIDLVAASVVIHYDRWWNAAREDQATDRVHRMGQTRGVHVLKLVTAGTLEEKIAALIDKKRALMESVVAEDEAGVVKTLSREELIGLLSVPLG